MTSFYNANANAANRSVVGVISNSIANQQIAAAKDFFRFQELYNIALNVVRADLDFFGEGDFVNLNAVIDGHLNTVLPKISSRDFYYNSKFDVIDNLNKLTRDENIFDNYRTLMQDVLRGLKKGSTLQDTNYELTKQIEQNELGYGIPLDEQIIQKFLNERKAEFVPFAEKVIFRQDNLDIKIWYAQYLQQHGPPIGGVFDVEKLSNIVNDLIVQGVITMDDFMEEETYTPT
jgi:hypothetical protein